MGVVPGPRAGGGAPRAVRPVHRAEHAALDALAAQGLEPDLVATHVLPGLVPARTAVTARLGAPVTAEQVAALAAAVHGAAASGEGLREGGDAAAALAALEDARALRAGRLVRFPGQDALAGDLAAGEIVRRSVVDRVVGSGTRVAADDVVVTAGFVRPQARGGEVVLLVERVRGGRLRPVEVEHPHECCGGAH